MFWGIDLTKRFAHERHRNSAAAARFSVKYESGFVRSGTRYDSCYFSVVFLFAFFHGSVFSEYDDAPCLNARVLRKIEFFSAVGIVKLNINAGNPPAGEGSVNA
jgi:hypothetical protein